jgi:hypothetical protein
MDVMLILYADYDVFIKNVCFIFKEKKKGHRYSLQEICPPVYCVNIYKTETSSFSLPPATIFIAVRPSLNGGNTPLLLLFFGPL